MLDGTGKAQHGNADENHAAGQDASNNRQVRDNGRGPCINADANQQETNHLKMKCKMETEMRTRTKTNTHIFTKYIQMENVQLNAWFVYSSNSFYCLF